MAIVLAIPDLHYPFAHKDSLDFLRAVRDKYRPTQTVCLGDECDYHALSNYDHDPEGYSAGHELDAAKLDLAKFYTAFPAGKSCVSNHTARPIRLATKAGLPSVFLREYRDVLEAPKAWSWHERVEVDDILYEHGEGFSGQGGALKCALGHMQSVVIGHLHAWAGIAYYGNGKHLIFGANAGCLIDRHRYAFAYGKHTPAKPVLGCIVVRDAIPTFIPMMLNGSGRWTRRI